MIVATVRMSLNPLKLLPLKFLQDLLDLKELVAVRVVVVAVNSIVTVEPVSSEYFFFFFFSNVKHVFIFYSIAIMKRRSIRAGVKLVPPNSKGKYLIYLFNMLFFSLK